MGQAASWSIAGHNHLLHFGLSSDVRGGLKGTVVSIYSDFLCLTYILGFPPVFLLQAHSLWLVEDMGLQPRSEVEACLCD